MSKPALKCKDCGKTWPHTERAGHCGACCETFIGLGAFDAHRVGEHGIDRHCEITEKHWADENGHWHTGKRHEEGEKGWWEAA